MPAAAAISPVLREIQHIRVLIEAGRHAEAHGAARALSDRVPENRDALYLLAVAQRYMGQIDPALATLERLQRLHPAFSRLYQERGHCHVLKRDAPRAIEAFLRAVNINPALPTSWARLESLYRMTGETTHASTAAAHVATLRQLPGEVVAATALLADGEFYEAEQIIRPFLLRNPNHVEAMRVLARIGMAQGILDDAEVLFAALLDLAPDYVQARFEYAQVLLDRHRHPAAVEQLERLLKAEPDNRQYQTLYATAQVGLGAHERALELYRQLLADAPRAAELHLSIAHALKTLGRSGESVAAYQAAAAARPDFGDAWWSLANLKTYRFSDVELAQMQTAEALASTGTVDRYHLAFALGKAFEDRGHYADSFRYYARGNAAKRAESRYQPELIERNTRLQIEVCTRTFFADRTGVGAPARDPIFIVGLPRAGSTLIEQILASHSQVDGTHELADVQRLVHELQGPHPDPERPRYPGVLAQLPREAFERLGERYLTETRAYRGHKAFFIDKNPNNFRHIGLIHLMLPNARIIDARREPMACCFSNLKQLFASGQEFSYSVEDIARYYRTYLQLMRHWDAVLPGQVLRVVHEGLVDDLEGTVRRVLDFCGLAFEPACVQFHKTERSVRTASAEQVRQPIYREGLDQWKHFTPFLQPLADALGDALDHYES